MKLPDYQSAVVPAEKLELYLLSEIHPVGRAKAQFFKDLGYDISDTGTLAQDLLTLARDGDVSNVQTSSFGTKYVVNGLIQTPSGVTVALRTVWIIEPDHPQPRLVTAYPG